MIYLDNAATTPMKPEVLTAMMPYMTEYFGNPSSAYQLAQVSREAVEKARHRAAALIGAEDDEIYFTSGGSESDNWALKAVAESLRDRGNHIITTRIEHHAILNTCRYLEGQGAEVTYLEVDAWGRVSLEALERAIRPDTILISVMAANNEIGTLQPIREIGRLAHSRGIPFHTDAVQAYGHIPINVKNDNIDLLSASGHKLNGPKGVGMLYIRRDVKLGSMIHGGSQERGLRAGTYNVPGIVGFGAAAALAGKTMQARAAREMEIRNYMIRRIQREIPFVLLNGDPGRRLPNNISFCFRFLQGEALLILLDEEGICVSGGSACSTGSPDPSHVLLAIGRSPQEAYSALRITLSEDITGQQADFVVRELKAAVSQLRRKSPEYGAFRRRKGIYR